MATLIPAESLLSELRVSRPIALSVLWLIGLSVFPCAAQAPVRLPLWPEGHIPAGKESEGEWDIQRP